jgi:hypothetical protein
MGTLLSTNFRLSGCIYLCMGIMTCSWEVWSVECVEFTIIRFHFVVGWMGACMFVCLTALLPDCLGALTVRHIVCSA